MKTLPNNDIARAIHLFLKDNPRKYDKVVEFLHRKRLLPRSPEILAQLKKIINQEEGKVEAKVSSAKKINHQMKSQLEHFLMKRYSAKEIVFEESLDPGLLGGLKLEVNGEIIDLSYKNKIRQLQEFLINA